MAHLPKKASKSKKTRKYGRKGRKQTHLRYTAERRWIRNQERQILRHLMKHPNDLKAKSALVVVRTERDG